MVDFVEDEEFELVAEGFGVAPGTRVGGDSYGFDCFFEAVPHANRPFEGRF